MAEPSRGATPQPPRRAWRVKDEQGESLIDFWRRFAPHSNEVAAAEIIDQLERERDSFQALLVESRRWQAEGEDGDPLGPDCWTKEYADYMKRLDAAIAGSPARSETRESIIEECAKVCDERAGMQFVAWPRDPALLECAKAIRALKNAAPQSPTTPRPSTPGPDESPDSTNAENVRRQPCERDSGGTAAALPTVTETPLLTPQTHDGAQRRIAECVREIEIIADKFGYDPCEWLVGQEE